MADKTMGQRIAERRKLLNLSQEAFGEKMGVSRQAISKWEADGAVPEIDKLIAMSRLFGVTVGWLLGVEEDPAFKRPDPGFTEEQMRIVDRIARQYAAPERNRRNTQSIVAACALIMLAVCVVIFLTYQNYVNQEFGYLSTQYHSLRAGYSDIAALLDQAMDRLDELTANERLLAEYDLIVEPWEDMSGTTVRFTGIPNNTKAQDQVWLSVRLGGEEVANAMCTLDGSAYVATVELPAADGYSYYFQAVHVGGNSSQQVLEADSVAVDLASALTGDVHAELIQTHFGLTDSVMTVNMNVTRSLPALGGDRSHWTQIDLVVLLNGGEIDRISLLDKFRDETWQDENGIVHSSNPDQIRFSHSFAEPQLEVGDAIDLRVEYCSAAGMTISRDVARITFWGTSTDFTNHAPEDS